MTEKKAVARYIWALLQRAKEDRKLYDWHDDRFLALLDPDLRLRIAHTLRRARLNILDMRKKKA